MKPIKAPLKTPIEAHGEKVSELTLNEPDLGGLDGVDLTVSMEGTIKINLGDLHKIIASMAGIPPSAAKKIKISDLKNIAPAVMDFLGEFLPTGAN
jgi:hypothetical protein